MRLLFKQWFANFLGKIYQYSRGANADRQVFLVKVLQKWRRPQRFNIEIIFLTLCELMKLLPLTLNILWRFFSTT